MMLQEGRVHFKTSGNHKTRTVDLSEIDLDCTADAGTLDLMAEGSGDVTTKLVAYDSAANLKTIRAGFAAEAVAAPSDEIIQTMAAYPEKLLCTFDPVQE